MDYHGNGVYKELGDYELNRRKFKDNISVPIGEALQSGVIYKIGMVNVPGEIVKQILETWAKKGNPLYPGRKSAAEMRFGVKSRGGTF